MSVNKRRTLAIKIETPGGDNPLTMRLVGRGPFFRGIAVANLALVGQGGSPPYAFSIVSGGDSNGGLNGLTLNTDGTFSGVPDDVGRFVFVATVSDSASQTYTHSFSLTFLPQLILVAGTPTPGEVDVAYSYQFIVRDLSGVTVTSGYTLHSGNLPAGLSINTNGTLSGTPTAPDGISYFVIRLTAGSDFLDIPCSLTIYPVLAGAVVGADPIRLFVGIPFDNINATTDYFSISGGRPPYRFAWTNLSTYPWLKFNYGRNTFSGTPVAVLPPFDVTGTLFDSLGAAIPGVYVRFSVENAQGFIQPQKNGGDVGPPGPVNYNFVEGANVSIAVTNDGETVDVEISAAGGSSSGIQTIEGVGPDSSGNLLIAGVDVDSNGDLFIPPGTTTVKRGPGCMFDGGGSALAGTITRHIEIPYALTITGWTIVADTTGNASIVVKHATYSAFPSMTTLFTATMTGAQKNQATGLSHACAAGDILQFVGSGFASLSVAAITLDGTGN